MQAGGGVRVSPNPQNTIFNPLNLTPNPKLLYYQTPNSATPNPFSSTSLWKTIASYLTLIYNISILEPMFSEQSSFRDMYSYPQKQTHNSKRKYAQTRSRLLKSNQSGKIQKQSFYQVVQKAKNVAMFTQTLKQKISQKRTLNQHTLKPQQFQFLENDSRQQHSKVYFEHNSKIVLTAQVIFVITIFLLLWNNTYELVFQKTIENHVIQCCSLVIYLLHVVLFHLTEYTNEKLELINDRNEIFSIYVGQKMIRDVVFLITLLIQISPIDDMQNAEWIFISTRIISLIIYNEVGGVCNKIQDLFSVSIQAEMTIAILKLFFKVVLFLHILSIAFNFLASVEEKCGVEHIWILDNNLEAETSFDRYIIAWYWAATILSTVGFGEITPKNNYERFFVSIIQVFCCMIIGYFVNVIGDLIKLRSESDEKYERQIRSLHRCLKSLSITPELKHKIRTHYFNKHFISKIYNPKEQKQILQQLNPNLQKSILQQNNIIALKKNPIFQKLAEETLMNLTLLMQRVILAPETVLYSRNSVEKKLWIIQNGVVEEFTNNFESSTLRKRIFAYNEQDSLVGWGNFLLQAAYKTLAKAKTFTIAYQIQWQKFQSSLQHHPHSYRRFLHLKHQTLEKSRLFINKCISCDRFTHNAINCPRIHFIRKDTTTLARQHKNLYSFQQKLRKQMKYKRQGIKFTWKTKFANGGLEKYSSHTLINNQSLHVSNGNNIQSLFKNVLFRQSAINFQKRKISILTSKREQKLQPQLPRDQQINDRQPCEKSTLSCDQTQQRQQPLHYDRLFSNSDHNDYMPSNDIENVLLLYSKRALIHE